MSEENSATDYRYARSVKNPPLYGLCTRDYDRDHRPRQWPPGTEYQYAYCSNYRQLLPEPCWSETGGELQDNTGSGSWSAGAANRASGQCEGADTKPFNKLYEITPLPIIDKHYRGARYKVDDPIGVHVKEELTKRKETPLGPVKLSCQDDMANVYTPNYRYKEWISRPMIQIHKEMDSNAFFCRQPETPTKYWDFYNVVRMHRPAKSSNSEQVFQPCTFMPLPINKDLPDVPVASANPHLGKLINFQTSQAPFQEGHFSSYIQSLC